MFNCRRRQFCCMNNNVKYDQDVIEDKCQNNCVCEYNENDCECGFDDEVSVFPENPVLAQSYVPIQYMNKTFKPCVGLKMGTIFPELVSPYMPGQSMKEIEYLEETNKIREGCNSCQ